MHLLRFWQFLCKAWRRQAYLTNCQRILAADKQTLKKPSPSSAPAFKPNILGSVTFIKFDPLELLPLYCSCLRQGGATEKIESNLIYSDVYWLLINVFFHYC